MGPNLKLLWLIILMLVHPSNKRPFEWARSKGEYPTPYTHQIFGEYMIFRSMNWVMVGQKITAEVAEQSVERCVKPKGHVLPKQVFFSNDQQLQKFILTGVTPTGTVLGTGSYGAVEEVTYQHRVCAGKRLHETLIDVGNEGVREVVHRFLQECQLMSSLRHPNITQFLGLCFLPGTQLPLLVMEHLETSLDDLLEHTPNIPLSLKCSVLEDVASGLLYLHSKQPPVIHRDLTSKNVLLTSSFTAKITDMGNSRIINMKPGQMAMTLTKYPGTLVYMPPEAQDHGHGYGPQLDVFSFGHLALYTLIQEFPGDLLPVTTCSPDNPEQLLARSELERRGQYIEVLSQVCVKQPLLVQLVKQCLHNAPQRRPTTEELLTRLQAMRVEVEGENGGNVIRLDMVRLRLVKQVKAKERRMEQLTQDFTQQQERYEAMLEARDRINHDLQIAVQTKDEQLRNNSDLIHQLQSDVQAKTDQLDRLQAQYEELQLRENTLREQLNRKEKEPQQDPPLHLTWAYGPDMPIAMTGHIQSAVLGEKMYVGGGEASLSRGDTVVMEYDIRLEDWNLLPSYRASFFAMTVVRNQLVLVGGCEQDSPSTILGVWKPETKTWTHPYPGMSTARISCSAVVASQWLVVAGGYNSDCGFDNQNLTSIELLDTATKQWHHGPPLSTPMYQMKALVIDSTCYLMGGFARQDQETNEVYCIPIQDLLTFVAANKKLYEKQKWKEMRLPGLCVTKSTPLSINGLLLAVGGKSDGHAVATIHLHQPDEGKWVKVGDLPAPCYNCTCANITDKKVLIAGGRDEECKSKRLYIMTINGGE